MGASVKFHCPADYCAYWGVFRLGMGEEMDPAAANERTAILEREHPDHPAPDLPHGFVTLDASDSGGWRLLRRQDKGSPEIALDVWLRPGADLYSAFAMLWQVSSSFAMRESHFMLWDGELWLWRDAGFPANAPDVGIRTFRTSVDLDSVSRMVLHGVRSEVTAA